jgi:hypothetical protein
MRKTLTNAHGCTLISVVPATNELLLCSPPRRFRLARSQPGSRADRGGELLSFWFFCRTTPLKAHNHFQDFQDDLIVRYATAFALAVFIGKTLESLAPHYGLFLRLWNLDFLFLISPSVSSGPINFVLGGIVCPEEICLGDSRVQATVRH